MGLLGLNVRLEVVEFLFNRLVLALETIILRGISELCIGRGELCIGRVELLLQFVSVASLLLLTVALFLERRYCLSVCTDDFVNLCLFDAHCCEKLPRECHIGSFPSGEVLFTSRNGVYKYEKNGRNT